MGELDSTSIITALLVILCSLAALDLWRQYAIKGDNYWYDKYAQATKYSTDFWTFGFRVEDLEMKAFTEHDRLALLKNTIESLAPKLLNIPALRGNQFDFEHSRDSTNAIEAYLYNDTAIYQIHCGAGGPVIRVGLNDFRTDSRDQCQVFTATTGEPSGPLTMFEMVRQSEGAFALRSLANGNFIKAVGPPQDNPMAPWKLVVGGPVPGEEERFRLTTDGLLYSAAMGGFFQCGGVEMVKGWSVSHSYYSSASKFILEPVDEVTVFKSHQLIDLSSQIAHIQNAYIEAHQTTTNEQLLEVRKSIGTVAPAKICLAVPMTSKGTVMTKVHDSPLWANLFDSFMKSIDWRANKFQFTFYLGFDKADEMYDTGDAWSDMRSEFAERATFRMKEQLMSDEDIADTLKRRLRLKLMHFEHLTGSPTQVVSQLVLTAYVDNFDYFYQVNDDTLIITPNWPAKFISTLASNPTIPNFGVTGPLDTNNDRIFTHSFVHRTHVEVFGHMFPPSFRNWWSDDWITTVYGAEHTFRCEDVEIKHNVGAQKSQGSTRYEVDKGAQLRLYEELLRGYVQIDAWLKKNSMPRLPLPAICGYSPLVRHLYTALKDPEFEALESATK